MSAAWLHPLFENVPLLKLDKELKAIALICRFTLSCEGISLEMIFLSSIGYPDPVPLLSTKLITALNSCNEAHNASVDIDST